MLAADGSHEGAVDAARLRGRHRAAPSEEEGRQRGEGAAVRARACAECARTCTKPRKAFSRCSSPFQLRHVASSRSRCTHLRRRGGARRGSGPRPAAAPGACAATVLPSSRSVGLSNHGHENTEGQGNRQHSARTCERSPWRRRPPVRACSFPAAAAGGKEARVT